MLQQQTLDSFKAFFGISCLTHLSHATAIDNATSNCYLPLLLFLISLGSVSLSLVMKEMAFERKLFSDFFFFLSLSAFQYKFRDLTIEELKTVNKTYPNFTFSMNTYSKK